MAATFLAGVDDPNPLITPLGEAVTFPDRDPADHAELAARAPVLEGRQGLQLRLV